MQCGKLGMKLISFDKLEMMTHLRALTKSTIVTKSVTRAPLKLMRSLCLEYPAFANRTYWTSGYDKRGPAKYNWCTANDQAVEKIDWKDDKPGSTAGCVQVYFPRIPRPTKAPPLGKFWQFTRAIQS
jgi:hypothetical protein